MSTAKNYLELKNAVNIEKALEIRQAFLTADYDKITQERRILYPRDFNECHPSVPNNDEVFSSYFCRSNYLETTELIKDCFENHLRPLIESAINIKISNVDLRCYKMTEGGHFRMHKDSYISDYGFMWYLSSNWKWDWGGLLVSLNDDFTAEVTIPEFNKLVILRHSEGAVPHLVTPVASYAKEPRIMLVGFMK